MGRLFNYSKPGKGVTREDLEKTGLELYFDILSRRLWKLMSLNFVYFLVSLPALVIGWFITTFAIFSLASFSGVEVQADFAGSVGAVGVLATAVLLQLCGSGPASAGMSFVLRRYVNDTHSWVMGDFFENLKNNFKQGLCVYVINIIMTCLLAVSIFFYAVMMKGWTALFLLVIVSFAAGIFFMMQMYTYQMVVSVRLKVKDIYRNAFLLVVAKLPWNLFAMLVSLSFTYLTIRLTLFAPPLGVVVACAILFSLTSFTQIFMTNNIVKELLLQPAMKAEKEEDESKKG